MLAGQDNSIDVVYDCVGQPGTGDRAMTKLKSGCELAAGRAAAGSTVNDIAKSYYALCTILTAAAAAVLAVGSGYFVTIAGGLAE